MMHLYGRILAGIYGKKQIKENRLGLIGALYYLFCSIIYVGTAFFLIWLYLSLSWPPDKGQSTGHYQDIYSKSPQPPSVRVACCEENFTCQCKESDASNPAEHEEKANEFIKNLRDLNAQEGMWRSANALVLLTLIQATIVAVSLYYLRQTLAATDRTAKAAENAERAYVDIELVPTYLTGTDREKFKVVVQITNYGKTPAKNISYEVSPLYRNEKNKVYRCGEGGSVYSYCCSKKPIEILPNNIDKPLMVEVHSRDGGTSEFDTIGFCKSSPFSMLVKWSYKTIFDGEVIDRLPDEYIAVFKWTAIDESAKFDVTGGALSAVDGISSLHFERDKESEYQYAD